MTTPDENGWTLITPDAPPPNNIFDVAAKYYDASMDQFLMRRVTDCVLVDGDIVVQANFPGEHPKPHRLVDIGFRATHWRHIPKPPVGV